MSLAGLALRHALELYLHRLPDFRGKWRVLRAANPLVAGAPVKLRSGDVRLHLDAADRTNRHALTGGHDPVVRQALRMLRTGDCFIDVGANCGVYSLLAARRVGASGLVVAFEPSPRSFAKLIRNIELNGATIVLPFQLGLAGRSGTARLDESLDGHSGRASVTDGHGSGSVPIRTLALRDFPAVRAMVGDRSTIIKVDVEGFEVSALNGADTLLSRAETKGVVVEIDARNLARYGASPDDVYGLLREYGFLPTVETDGAQHYDQLFKRREP